MERGVDSRSAKDDTHDIHVSDWKDVNQLESRGEDLGRFVQDRNSSHVICAR